MAMRRIIAIIAVFALAACAGDGAAPATTTADSAPGLPVILDYSPTVSDAGALLYLAADPRVDLLAVTLPGTGEADCAGGVRRTLALLAAAGHEAVPVACAGDPAVGNGHDWPAGFRDAAARLGEGWLAPAPQQPPAGGDAVRLLTDTIERSPRAVTVVATAPLTNVARAFGASPALARRIDKLVIMGGAADVAGNVADEPTAEWNFYADPGAARAVLGSAAPVVLVPLDATNQVPWTPELLTRLRTLDAPAAVAEQHITGEVSLEGIFLWDELAAVVALVPSVARFDTRTIAVDDVGATRIDSRGGEIQVAIGADGAAAGEEFLRTLNGGGLPPIEPLTEEERTYLDAADAATERFSAEFVTLFATPPTGEEPGAAATRIATLAADAVGQLYAALGALTAPPAFAAAHRDLLAPLTTIEGHLEDFRTSVDAQTGDDPFARVEAAARSSGIDVDVQHFNEACQALSGLSVLGGGPQLCEG